MYFSRDGSSSDSIINRNPKVVDTHDTGRFELKSRTTIQIDEYAKIPNLWQILLTGFLYNEDKEIQNISV